MISLLEAHMSGMLSQDLPKGGMGVGKTYSQPSTYPFDETDITPDYEEDEDEVETPEVLMDPKTKHKFQNKTSMQINNPYDKRYSYGNGSSPLPSSDGLSENPLSLKNVDFLIEYIDNVGGVSPLVVKRKGVSITLAGSPIANGAGIYKTGSARRTGGGQASAKVLRRDTKKELGKIYTLKDILDDNQSTEDNAAETAEDIKNIIHSHQKESQSDRRDI